MFDIKDFYPSISIQRLTSSLNFAETYLSISAENKKIIYHARKLYTTQENYIPRKKYIAFVSL